MNLKRQITQAGNAVDTFGMLDTETICYFSLLLFFFRLLVYPGIH